MRLATRRRTLLRAVLAGELLLLVLAFSAIPGSTTKAAGPAGASCHALTMNVGSGIGTADAIPDSSGGCPAGQYTPGY
ncbi:MAG: hypothetical protein U1B78_03635, partial [Dehalococcoidia bacterium]|nr:hypothetical protein [Dehalococcoidia bacterium]